MTLHKGRTVALLQPMHSVTETGVEKSTEELEVKGEREMPEYLRDMYEKAYKHLDQMQSEKVKQLILRFQDTFTHPDSPLGRASLVKHEIDTGNTAPIKQACRRLPLAQRPLVEAELDKMLCDDVIEASTSPWASPIVLATKKDGSVRFCVDFRAINARTRKDAYPLPRIDETLDTLSGAQWFCSLDLQSAFWQVEMAEKDKEKTAFTTHKGLFQFKVMPFWAFKCSCYI